MAPDSPLFSHEIGNGLPVLIIHGWELDGAAEELDLEPIFTKTPGFQRIYVDLPGMGSTPANNITNLDDIYDRLVDFIDNRLGKSNFLLTGSSCGGYLARALAQKYSAQVDGLLLRVPLIEPRDDLRDLDPFQPLIRNEQLVLSSDDKALLGHVHIQTPAYVKSLRAKYEAVQPSLTAANKDVLNAIREDPERYKISIDLDGKKLLVPTLILCGRQDEVVGYRDALRLLELYPRSTYAVLDRGRHDLPIDENGLFGALVRDWLTRVEEWRAHADR